MKNTQWFQLYDSRREFCLRISDNICLIANVIDSFCFVYGHIWLRNKHNETLHVAKHLHPGLSSSFMFVSVAEAMLALKKNIYLFKINDSKRKDLNPLLLKNSIFDFMKKEQFRLIVVLTTLCTNRC